ncbi:MAG: glycosyltransferase [Acidobacteria bacterium]|nr:glycosyltransferase [Acidobacteriota bacterium]
MANSIESGCPSLTVVVPAWNERENLERLLPALGRILRESGVQSEVVVVDGGSIDGSRQVVEAAGARFLAQQERGYGGALRAGFAAAQGEYVVTMDADCSHDPAFIPQLWRQRDLADVLVASRYVAGGGADMSLFRRTLSGILNGWFRWMFAVPVRDLSSGFRLYRREQVRGLTLRAADFDVLEEILVQLHIRGFRILELPYRYQRRQVGKSKARLLAFGWAYLKTVQRLRRLQAVARTAC